MRKSAKIVALVVLLTAAGLLAYMFPVTAWAQDFISWVRGLGFVGALLYFLVYVTGTVLLLPGAVLTITAGFLYGTFYGTLLVSAASVLGATTSFLLARSIARPWVEQRMASHPKFAAIDEAVAEHGFKVVFLLRLEPLLAFTLLNYALGLTRVRLRDYMAASWTGMLPATILYVYVGSIIQDTTQLLHGKLPASGIWGQMLLWGGLGATALLVALLTRIAKRALDRQLQAGRPPAHAKGMS